MTAPAAATLYTEDEYLAMDRAAEVRSEYHAGHIFAMSGGSPTHSLIPVNLALQLGPALRKRGCLVYSADLRVRIKATKSFVYPDLTVICGQPNLTVGSNDVVDNPILVVEVLSPSTERYDRSEKAECYRTLESLREYLLVSQTKPTLELYSRNANGKWELSEAHGLDATLEIESLGVTISLAEVYYGVQLGGNLA